MIPGKQYTPELFLQIAWRRKWWLLVPAVVIIAGGVLWTRQLKDVYKAEALIQIVPPRVPANLVQSSAQRLPGAGIEGRVNTISQQVLSRGRLEKIIEDLEMYPDLRKTEVMEDLVEQMRTEVSGPTIVRGDAFRVGFSSGNPRLAMRVAERLASLFIDESLRDREVLAEGTSQFLDAQLEDARRQLVDNEKRLEEYGRRHNGELPAQLSANVQGLHNTEIELQSLDQSLNRDRDRHIVLERAMADALSGGGVDPATLRQATRTEPTEDPGELFNFLVAPRMVPMLAGGGGGKDGGGGGGALGGFAGGGGGVPYSGDGSKGGGASGGKGGDSSEGKGAPADSAKGGASDADKGGTTPGGSRGPARSAADQLRAAQAELRTMELRLTPQHPDIIRARRAVAELQRRADAEAAERPLDGDVSPTGTPRPDPVTELRGSLARLDKQIVDKTEAEKRLHELQADYQRRIEATPTRENELTELTRDYGTLRTTYTNLLQKRLDAQLAANLERRQIGETFKLLEPPRIPTKPSSPNRPRFYQYSVAAGLLVGLMLAGLFEYFDRTMRSEDDVRSALKLPVLAAIPLIRVHSRRRGRIVPLSDKGAAACIATVVAMMSKLLS